MKYAEESELNKNFDSEQNAPSKKLNSQLSKLFLRDAFCEMPSALNKRW
jgi:hypothetical protein